MTGGQVNLHSANVTEAPAAAARGMNRKAGDVPRLRHGERTIAAIWASISARW